MRVWGWLTPWSACLLVEPAGIRSSGGGHRMYDIACHVSDRERKVTVTPGGVLILLKRCVATDKTLGNSNKEGVGTVCIENS